MVEQIGDATVVRFPREGFLGEQTVEAIGADLSAAVAAQDRPRIILDLTSVTFLGSAALGKLMQVRKRAQTASGSVVLVTGSPEALKVLNAFHLERLFTIVPTVDEALAVLKTQPGPPEGGTSTSASDSPGRSTNPG